MIPRKDGKLVYVPFMPSQLAFFRNAAEGGLAFKEGDVKTGIQKVGSNFSMGLKLASDLVGNKDYFGNQIYDDKAPFKEIAKDVAKYIGLSYNHPYFKGIYNVIINKLAEKNPMFQKYQEIKKLTDEGKREEADSMINMLSKEEQESYYELKKQNLKPVDQVLSEMMEIPLKFGTVGKIESQKYYKKLDDMEKELKAIPEGEERTKKFQELVLREPQKERKSYIYAMYKRGIDTKGVSTYKNKLQKMVKQQIKSSLK